MTDINIIALGGVREYGKNFYLVEINDSMFILDAGLKYPETEQLGVDLVIPSLDYVIENKDKVQGVFLSHGHADAIGALPYLLAEVPVPVFGSELTIELAKLFVKANNSTKRFKNFHVVDSDTEIEFKDGLVSFFKTTHSIPESLGVVIGTDKGNIVYTGDFKFDQASREGYQTDLARLADIGKEGVLALLADSANATSNEQTASEAEVGEEMDKVIAHADGRIIIAAVASNLVRIQQVFDSAAAYSRRVVLTGTDAENIVRTALRLKKLVIADEKLLIKPKDMSKFEDHELIVLEAGRMGEPINSLQKMAIGRHRHVQIKDGDLVYIVTTPSAAKEAMVARVENLIYKAGGSVKLITQHLRVSGHANARDLQLMINLVKPKYLFPIQGEYRDLAAHAHLAEEAGMLPENIHIMKRGDIMVFDGEGFLHEGAVPASDVMIDGNAIGDVGNIVLRDRKVLSEDGIFIVAITVSKKEKRIISKAKVNTRGFVYVKKSRDILRESAELVNTTVGNYLQGDHFDWSELKSSVREELSRFLFEQTKRRPAILPVVMEVR
ncbi:metallo-beta-lactamase superfamily protein [Streptococcus equi subsp. zooepidemicus Sz35]|uniref:Ribonuclease J n=1 Tax=Streptococcus equi subsp. zooepidemicus TaxID=40041 RepID=A0A7Z8ZVR9_STRSZ|nr:ribonuclease J [Streptococcus equi]KIS10780.1 metallo-beta-lactamase superfamily protein [Streptococcus equi subsp. zooepidemicus Sz57]KIS14107.1 metallo-beta-lactamase superfamily protein [Streptococcus equi subsp. zooepidemicus SzAM60]KIS17611.1 metallo-beta-lactamase superfamily protein [Streptococcus equi subsp. zooepidemicus SzAM35]KIS19733.1 metallo-beta-lactamase superfamily protein [Streptococcus equi subsp. zooepidemicus Sz35]MCD3387263.1 ribonuclease J [Streptococcus equi subsp. z